MYTLGQCTGPATTVAGICTLPNTGGNELLFVVSLLTTLVGVAVTLSTVARLVAKRAYNAQV